MYTNAPLFRFTLSSRLGTLVLRHDPEGWQSMGVQLSRDRKYHGLSTEYSPDRLGFAKQGKQYLEQAYAQDGIEAEVQLLIEEHDPNAFAWRPYYHGRLNFLTRNVTDTLFQCNLEQRGVTQSLLNRAGTTVDLLRATSMGGVPLPPLATTDVELHSRAILLRYEATQAEPIAPALPGFVTDDATRFALLYVGLNKVVSDDLGIQEVFGGPVMAAIKADAVPIYRTRERGRFEFALDLTMHTRIARTGNGYGDFDTADVAWYFRIGDAETQLATVNRTNISGAFDEYARLVLTTEAEVEIDTPIYLFGVLRVEDTHSGIYGMRFEVTTQAVAGSTFTFSAVSQTDPTQCAGLLAYEALERLVQNMTDNRAVFRSEFLGRTDTVPAYPKDGPGSLMLATGGFQVRGFPLAVQPLTASWAELFDSLAVVHALGMGLERAGQVETVRVEPFAYWYADRLVLELAEPVRYVVSEQAERYYQAVEAGYQKWQTGQTNGLQEVNAKRTWTTPLTQTSNKLSLLAPAILSGFHLEHTRRQRYDATATQDDRADNELFLVQLRRTADGLATERDELFAQIEGLYSPSTVYNLRHTPARILRRHAATLASGLQPLAARLLTFASGEGNNEVVTRLASETAAVVEKEDVPISALLPARWQPYVYELSEVPLRSAQLHQILADPYGRVRFYDAAGQRHEGWVLEMKHTAVDRAASLTLLPCSTLLPLI